jgi:hypothetical protein
MVSGSHESLGVWDINKAIPLTTDEKTFPHWKTKLSMPDAGIPFQFKFIIKSSDGSFRWESLSGNRCANIHGDATLACGTFGNNSTIACSET